MYIPFSWQDQQKQKDMVDLLSALESAAEANDYFEIGPESTKLLKEVLDGLIEGYNI